MVEYSPKIFVSEEKAVVIIIKATHSDVPSPETFCSTGTRKLRQSQIRWGQDRHMCCDWLCFSIANCPSQIWRHQHLPVTAINMDELDIDTWG